MSIKTYRPTTPARRGMTVSGFDGVDKHAQPEKSLLEVLKKSEWNDAWWLLRYQIVALLESYKRLL